MTRTVFAPAKVNLYLHVGTVQADGYHPLDSLMVFGDVGDRLSFVPDGALALEIEGEFAGPLRESASEDNLVLRAVRLLLASAGAPPAGRLTLVKNLPIAAGLGGGSSDAAAAMRLVRDALGIEVAEARLFEIAERLGADGVACLTAAPVRARGRGERIETVRNLPQLDAVLVNPRVPCPTGAVYRSYDAQGAQADVHGPELPSRFTDAAALIGFLRLCRNDLERCASRVAPAVAEVLTFLGGRAETGLARVSGSGATVFALCEDAVAARSLADAVGRARPEWWCSTCRLGGPWSFDEATQSVLPSRAA